MTTKAGQINQVSIVLILKHMYKSICIKFACFALLSLFSGCANNSQYCGIQYDPFNPGCVLNAEPPPWLPNEVPYNIRQMYSLGCIAR